jgi:GNAT superfamily N-acetyltransferase
VPTGAWRARTTTRRSWRCASRSTPRTRANRWSRRRCSARSSASAWSTGAGARWSQEFDRQVVGYALLMSFWSNEYGGELCNVDELYVQPAQHGRGLSTELLIRLGDDRTLWPGRPVRRLPTASE